MEAVDEPKPFVVPPQIIPKRRTRQAKSAEAPVQETPVTPFDEAIPPVAAQSPAPSLPDHSRVPPAPGKTLKPGDLMTYWNSVPELERNEWFIAYIYRGLPICDVTQTLTPDELKQISQGKKRKPATNIGKLTTPLDPERWQQQLLESYGAGDYGIRLNDQHPSVKKTVCCAAVDPQTGGSDFRNWDSYPPVLEPAEVVLSEEANAPYLRWARLRGIAFPGDPEFEGIEESTEEEDNDMAALEAVLKQNKDLSDNLLQMAKEKNTAPAAAPAPTIDATARAQMGGVETVVEASKQGMKIMGEAMKQVMESQVKASDPAEQLKTSIEIAKLMQPAPAPPSTATADLLTMMKMQMDAQEKNFDRVLQQQREAHKESLDILKSRLDSLEKEKQTAAVPAASSNEEAFLDKMIRFKTKLDTFAEENAPAGPQGTVWERMGERLLEKVDNLPGILEGLAKLRNGIPSTGAAATPQSAPQAIAPPEEDKDTKMRKMYRRQIHQSLVGALKTQTAGYDFAAAVIQAAGQEAYDALTKDGYQGVMEFLQCVPELYAELIQPPPLSGDGLDKFVRELLERQKVMQALQIMTGQVPPPQQQKPQRHNGPMVS